MFSLLLPQHDPNYRQRVAEGWTLFVVPGTLLLGKRSGLYQSVGHERYQREQPQETRRGSQDGKVCPLPLRLHSQMPAHLLESNFHAQKFLRVPAPHEPAQNISRFRLRVRREKGFGIEGAVGVTHEYPPKRNDRFPRMIPDRCAGGDLDFFVSVTVPPSGLQVALTRCHSVDGSSRRSSSLGRRSPFLRGLPRV